MRVLNAVIAWRRSPTSLPSLASRLFLFGLGTLCRGAFISREEHDRPVSFETNSVKLSGADFLKQEFGASEHGVDAVSLVTLKQGIRHIGLGPDKGTAGKESVVLQAAVELGQDRDAIREPVQPVEALKAGYGFGFKGEVCVVGADELKTAGDLFESFLGLEEHLPRAIDAEDQGAVMVGDHRSKGDAGADGRLKIDAVLGATEGAIFVIHISKRATAPDGKTHGRSDHVVDASDYIGQGLGAVVARWVGSVGGDQIGNAFDHRIVSLAVFADQVRTPSAAECKLGGPTTWTLQQV